jgi:hypothetical protein
MGGCLLPTGARSPPSLWLLRRVKPCRLFCFLRGPRCQQWVFVRIVLVATRAGGRFAFLEPRCCGRSTERNNLGIPT